MHSDIISLKDVGLEKLKSRKRYSISDASSGEQSVVIGMLGIASQIQNNTLICIDEPEICLHPEWQEKYIKLLFSTFQNFKGCHFLIATHSPQIISKLESTNCYVLTMETGNVINAKYLNNNSADFQLATVFNSPGFKNEYLSRLAFSIMSKVAKTKKFDDEDLKGYELLTQQVKNMEENDPLVHIISLMKNLRTRKSRKKMPEIKKAVQYNASQQIEISTKLNDPNFKYSDWGNDDLLNLRKHIRAHYRKVQKKVCAYCKNNLSLQSVNNSHIEHILPKSLFPQFVFEPKNLFAVCADCNEIKNQQVVNKEEIDPLKRKYKRYPKVSEAFRVYHPHFDNYKDHIHKCGDIYFNVSDKGAYTILICKLNRKLYDYGMEPMLLGQPELFELMNKCLNEKNYTIDHITISFYESF